MMAHFAHDLWGRGRGPAAALTPQGRILAGALLVAACMTAPAGSAAGTAFIAAVTLAWAVACGIPRRAAGSFALLGLAMFLPYFLLVPLLAMERPDAAAQAFPASAAGAPWDVFLHGMAGMFLAAATASSLGPSDLRRGLLALRVPGAVTAIVVQVLHQTGELLDETRRLAAACAVRGAAGRGKAATAVLAALPRVWLPRIIGRAERVAAAMELRGYAETDLRVFGAPPLGAADAAVVIALAAVLAIAAALRLGWIR
jgi:energy-coupling factor transporter transmembrane protein EcfT